MKNDYPSGNTQHPGRTGAWPQRGMDVRVTETATDNGTSDGSRKYRIVIVHTLFARCTKEKQCIVLYHHLGYGQLYPVGMGGRGCEGERQTGRQSGGKNGPPTTRGTWQEEEQVTMYREYSKREKEMLQ